MGRRHGHGIRIVCQWTWWILMNCSPRDNAPLGRSKIVAPPAPPPCVMPNSARERRPCASSLLKNPF